jgi:hypothetical protein
MRKLNNMDMNNTPFDVPSGIVGKKDSSVALPNRFSSANGVNSEKLARQINNNASRVLTAISKLDSAVREIPVDDEISVVTLDLETVQRIQSLVDNVHISFQELVKLGK